MKNKKIKDNSLFSYYGFTEKDAKEYPVISGILKELTPERIKKELEEIQKIKLPPGLQKWVKEYKKLGQRSFLFWQFMFEGNQMFSFIKKTQRYEIIELKILTTMLIILFDDIADQTKDTKLLDDMMKIVLNNKKNICYKKLPLKNKKYLNFTLKLWKNINQKIKKLPSFLKLKDIFEYDIHQTLNAIKYAWLVNKNPYLINKTEFSLYAPHTLQGMINCSLDLMCFNKINLEEIRETRESFWDAQKMGRISNCLSTWQDEFKKEDFTNAVLAYAISYEIINLNDLYKKDKNKIINKIKNSNIEKKLFKEWEDSYNKINSLRNKGKIIKSDAILKQLEKFLVIYLSLSKFYDHRYDI